MSDYLPQEVVVQILSWLPPKSLLRFRCVSKLWCSLITCPNFITMHTHHHLALSNHNNKPRRLVRTYSPIQNKELYSVHFDTDSFDLDSDVKIKFPFGGMPRFYFRIVGSCNGLLCLTDDLFGYTNTVILWNPAIKRKLTLPIPSFMLEQVSMNMIVLGFGFDCKNNDYKVVRIGYFQGDNVAYKVEVYTVKGRAWRGISGHPPRYRIVEYYWSQAFINGSVHWVAYHRSEGLGSKLNCLIMSFDVHDEVFNEMLLPVDLVHKSPMNMFTAKIGESLALFQCDRQRWSKYCSIWVMKEYGVVESWSKLFNADVDGCFIPVGIPLGVRNNLEILVAAARSGELISYDPRVRRSMNLGIVGTSYSFYVDSYAESLALFLEGEKVCAWLELSSESDSSEEEEDDENDGVEKNEFWIHSTMIQYLTALLTEH